MLRARVMLRGVVSLDIAREMQDRASEHILLARVQSHRCWTLVSAHIMQKARLSRSVAQQAYI